MLAGGRRTGATEDKPKIACGRRQRSVWLAVLLVNAGFTGLAEVGLGEPIPIVLVAPATPAEQIAAWALRRCLNPDGVFLLGRAASAPEGEQELDREPATA